MSVYDLHFNKDDVTIRNILIGLLATLHDNIQWYNQIGSDIKDRKLIKIPFYFSTTGTERYLQDNFLNNLEYTTEDFKAETFYNSIPRGIVDFKGLTVEAQSIVNKYVRMEHQVQEQDGTLNTYSSETFWVPILLTIEAKIYTDSILDQLKCTEGLIQTFFKSKSYQIDVGYTRIPCLIVFPDDYDNERTIEYSFTDKREFITTCSLQVKSFIPIFKPETRIFVGNRMESFKHTTYIPPIQFGPDGGSAAIPGDTQTNRSVGTPGLNDTSPSKIVETNTGIPPAGGQIADVRIDTTGATGVWPSPGNNGMFPPNGGSTAGLS